MMEGILISENGSALYPVWTAPDARETTIYAANEVASFLSEISSARFTCIQCNEPPKLCIAIGDSPLLANDGLLGHEGFAVKTIDGSICITGGYPRGIIYGAYAFLEVLGCRWFSSKASHIPRRSRLVVEPLDIRETPSLEYREYHSPDAHDANWSVRNRHHGNFTTLDTARGGKIFIDPFVHTFDMIIPVKEYYYSHPEYFSLVDGKRLNTRQQLCLTNPDVLQLTVEKIFKWIEKNPDVSIISVSQNDCYNPCECEECKKLDDEEGCHAGSLIHFINAVAERVESRYPNITIGTLAYQYTRRAPKNTRPRHNVCVWLCSIECCFAHPLRSCGKAVSFPSRFYGTSFQQDLADWARICNRLYIWDYAVNYSHYLMPYPNFHIFSDNIKYYIENNVKGIFIEGAPTLSGGTEFAELRAYVLTKLLWNPDQDTNDLAADFINGYYKAASVPMLKYFHLFHDELAANPDIHFGIYDPARPTYITPKAMEKGFALLKKALASADDDEIYRRVRTVWMSLHYWELYIMPLSEPTRHVQLDVFFEELEKLGITEITEGHTLKQTRKLMDMGEVWRQRTHEGIQPPPSHREL